MTGAQGLSIFPDCDLAQTDWRAMTVEIFGCRHRAFACGLQAADGASAVGAANE